MPRRASLAVRFEQKFCPEPTTGCWLWTAAVLKRPRPGQIGYGRVGTGARGGYELAHRVSWRLHRGVVPMGLWVLHKCDTPPCVNPDHLFLGTPMDNTADAVAKGRRGYGERSANAILTYEKAEEIRAAYAAGEGNYAEVGRKFGIGRNTVWLIASGRRWVRRT